MPTVFSAAQLAASAAAGDPRTQDSFATTAEWHAYQAEWFISSLVSFSLFSFIPNLRASIYTIH